MTDHATAERPLVLKAEQVRAILDGSMTEIRLPVRPAPYRSGKHPDEWMRLTGPGMTWTSNRERREVWKKHPRECVSASEYHVPLEEWLVGQCPLGRTGDTLWVREGFAMRGDIDPDSERSRAIHYLHYRESYDGDLGMEWHDYGRWRSSTSMPRWAARLVLAITDVRVERTDAGADAAVRDARPAFDWVVRFRRVGDDEGSKPR